MRAAHNIGRVGGGNGAAFLPRLVVVVESKHFARGRVEWLREGEPHNCAHAANAAADKLRAGGLTVRVRPVVL